MAVSDSHDARYRVIEHEPDGRSEGVSRIQRNDPAQAMKALVLSVSGRGKGKRAVIAVISGSQRLNMKALLSHVGAQKGWFAQSKEAADLTGFIMGSIPPLSFQKDLAIVVYSKSKVWIEVAFKAGRLDCLVMLYFKHYEKIVAREFGSFVASEI